MSQCFAPSRHQVHEIHNIIASRGRGIPNELVLDIMRLARYWPEVTTESTEYLSLVDGEWSLENSAAHVYLWATMPAPPHVGEKIKIQEIEFTIASHDQTWTTESTKGSYQTSSWFEASIFRPIRCPPSNVSAPDRVLDLNTSSNKDPTCLVDHFHKHGWLMVKRSGSISANRQGEPRLGGKATEKIPMESSRMHCEEMKVDSTGRPEGLHSWWLQGNEVADTSIFDRMTKYHVTWGCARNDVYQGNEGAGRGEGFVDSLQQGDVVGIWMRIKRRGWENHCYGIRMTMRYSI